MSDSKKTHETQWNATDENIDFLLSYNVILVCNLHVNAGILHHSLFFYSLGHIGKLSGNFTNRVFRLIAHASYHLRLASLVFKLPGFRNCYLALLVLVGLAWA